MGAPEAFTATTDVGHFIAGQRVAGTSGRQQPVWNPTTGAVARQVALASVAEVNAAVAAARAAFPAWADTPPIRRARVMFKFLELLNQHRDALAHAITAEHGKVFTDAQGDSLTVDQLASSSGLLVPTDDGWMLTPAPDFNGEIVLQYEVRDGRGGVAPATRSVHFAPVNDAPIAVAAFEPPEAATGQPLLWRAPPDLFVDADGDPLVLAATMADGSPLPAWLSFDGDSATLSGTPPAAPVASSVPRTTW